MDIQSICSSANPSYFGAAAGAGLELVSLAGFNGMLSTSLPKPLRSASSAFGDGGGAALGAGAAAVTDGLAAAAAAGVVLEAGLGATVGTGFFAAVLGSCAAA